MRSMPPLCGGGTRTGSCVTCAAAGRRFAPGTGHADAGAVPRQQAAGNSRTHVAGRDGLFGRGAFGDAYASVFVATVCLDGGTGRSLDLGLAIRVCAFLYRADAGGGPVAAGPRYTSGEPRRATAAMALRKLT